MFSYHDGDIFGCVADIGWITGHSYVVYGPLANGGTTVLFESTPIYPDPGMNIPGSVNESVGSTHLQFQYQLLFYLHQLNFEALIVASLTFSCS